MAAIGCEFLIIVLVVGECIFPPKKADFEENK